MNYSAAYLSAFYALAHRMNFLHLPAPDTALVQWQKAVDTLQQNAFCHSGELDEALNEVRAPLETFLVSDELGCLPEHAFFMSRMAALDAKFKALTVAPIEQGGSWARLPVVAKSGA